MTGERSAATWALAVAWLLGCGEGPVAPAQAPPDRSAVAAPGPPPGSDGGRYVAVLAAREAVDVAARHPGILREVVVRPGDRVDTGQVLARLEEQPMREALALARAGQQTARAVIAQREVEIAQARRSLEIEEELVAGGIGAEKNLEEARFTLQRAGKARDYAVAQLAEQNARVAQLERQLGEAAIVAPFAGTISLRYRDPGALVDPGTAIVRLIRTDSLWVRFAVPPQHAARLAVGDPVVASLDSPPASLPATVGHISPELDPASRLIFVEAELAVPEDLQGKLRAGLPAWVAPAE